MVFWINSLAKKGHKVTVLHSRKSRSEEVHSSIEEAVSVYDFYYGSVRRLSPGGSNTAGEVGAVARSPIKEFLARIKRRFINPTVGQLADPNLLSVLMTVLRCFFAKKSLTEFPSDEKTIVVSSAPPWSSHLLGWGIARKHGLPWIIDYRDQFSGNHMFGGALRGVEVMIDKALCKRANLVVTVSESMARYYEEFHDRVEIIHNGYDPGLFWPESVDSSLPRKPLTQHVIRYFGTIQHESRLPVLLFDALLATSVNVKVEFYGDVPLVKEWMRKYPELSEKVQCFASVPFSEVRNLMATADVNLLSETLDGTSLSHRGVMTTKMFEYLSVQRPILALISPRSDMVSVLRKAGLLIGPMQSASEIVEWFDQLSVQESVRVPDRHVIMQYSRENGVKKLLAVAEGVA